MKEVDKRFIQYCIKNNFLTVQQMQIIGQRVSKRPENRPIWMLIAELFQLDSSKVESVYLRFLAVEAPTLSEGHYQVILCLKELILKAIVNIDDANTIFREQRGVPPIADFLKILLDKNFISSEQYMETKLFLESLGTAEIQQRLKAAPQLNIQLQNGFYVVQQKSILQIDHYEILKELGRGGMGVVYLARDKKLSRLVALKVMSNFSNEKEKQRFIREAQLSASLKHSNIVSVYEVGEYKNVNYFTMEYIEGLPLNIYIRKFQPDTPQCLAIIKKIAEALSFAHSKNIIHRDIKPANIIMSLDHTPYLMDFGLAKHIRQGNTLTVSGTQIGTPAYMSPEQVNAGKNIGKEADVYGLGAIFYEMLVGKPPFIGANLQAIFKAIVSEEVIPPRKLIKDLPRDVNTICLRCLEKKVENRYPNAKAVSLDIERYLEGQNIKAKPVGVHTRFQNWVVRNKVSFSSLLLFIATAIFLSYKLFFAPAIINIHTYIKLNAKTTPVKAFLIIDDDIKQYSDQSIHLSYGYHKITVQLPGCISQTFFVNVSPGEELTLEKEILRETGYLTLNTNLSEVEVVLQNPQNNEKIHLVAPTHKYKLYAGKYEVTIRKNNYFAQTTELEVPPDGEKLMYVDLEAMELWNAQLYSQPQADKMALSDINKDGAAEILTTNILGDINCYDLQKQERLWTVMSSIGQAYNGQIAQEDVNNDGYLDIISSHHYDFVIIDGKNQNTLFQRTNWWGHTFLIADVNGDLYPELILFSRYKGIECYDIRNQKALWFLDHNVIKNVIQINSREALYCTEGMIHIIDLASGRSSNWYKVNQLVDMAVNKNKELVAISIPQKGIDVVNIKTRQLVYHISTNKENTTIPLFSDVNHNGQEELLIISDRLYCLDPYQKKVVWAVELPDSKLQKIFTTDLDYDSTTEVIVYGGSSVYVYNSIGEVINLFQISSPIKDCLAFDTNNSGTQEIICLSPTHLHCFQYKKNDDIYVFREIQNVYFAASTDLNNDGYDEFILSTNTGNIYCLEGKSKHIMWQSKVADSGFYFTTGNVINHNEIVAYIKNHIILLDSNGKEIWRTKLKDELTQHAPFIGDINNDGQMEIIVVSYWDGFIYALHGNNGQIIWESRVHRIFARPLIDDVDNDGELEIVITNGMQLGENSFVQCFKARNGEVKWRTFIPQHAEGFDIVKVDIDNDGKQELLVGGVAGNLSCIKADTGNIYWHKRYLCSGMYYPYLVGDFDVDNKLDLIAQTKDKKLISIDVTSGNLKWMKERAYSLIVESTNDFNDDSTTDVVSTSLFYSLVVTNSANGEWLGNINHLGIIKKRFVIKDTNNDQVEDALFINDHNYLVFINNWKNHIKKAIARPKWINYNQKNDIQILLRLNKLSYEKSYSTLVNESTYFQGNIIYYPDIVLFYQATCYVKQNKTYAISLLEKVLVRYANFYEAKFVLMLCYLEQDKTKARRLMLELLKNSIWEFEEYFQKYQNLLTNNEIQQIMNDLPHAVEKADVKIELHRAYQHAKFMKKEKEMLKWLPLILKYTNKNSENYQEYRRQYIDTIAKSAATKTSSIYTFHHSIEVINSGLEYLQNDYELIALRGQYYLLGNINEDQGLKDLEFSLQENPKPLEILVIRARYYYQQHKYQEAANDFEKCFRLENKRTFDFSLSCALSLIAARKYKEAFVFLNNVNLQGTEKKIYSILTSLAQQKNAEALEKMKKIKVEEMVQTSSHFKWIWNNMVSLISQNRQ